MKTPTSLTEKIMQKVITIEKRTVWRWMNAFLLSLLFSFMGVIIVLISIQLVFREQDTFSVLSLFGEDPEIIRDYFGEIVATIWSETPKVATGILILFLSTLFATLGIFGKNYRRLAQKQESLTRYLSQKEKTMAKKTNPRQFVVFGVAGVAVVLLILFFYPTMQKSTFIPATQKIVTTENEFSQPKESLKAKTPEEQQAQQAFFFSVSAPLNNTTVATSSIVIRGKTVAKAEVFVNEMDTRADAQGLFSLSYPLDEGENYIIVGANDQYGNYDEIELIVYYQP